ncbi:MAG: glycoside hydrolase family 16 [Daejeonella sp.]|nr:glycoside hydrolase family 16 [Daejeonella sp.]
MKTSSLLLAACCFILFSSCKKDAPKKETIVVPPIPVIEKVYSFETTPLWSDEFDYAGAPDPLKWGYDIGGSGWGNNELQYYTNSIKNASVADGKLTIAALKESFGGRQYTSARLISKGKGDFLYGKIEVMAKLPSAKGTWPAIWMLPTDWEYGDWPKSGEMDIMEHVGYDPNNIHVTMHTEAYYFKINTQKSATRMVSNVSTEFHKYSIEWSPKGISGLIDDDQMFYFANENGNYSVWPFDKRFHLLLNIAFGGDWGGAQGIDDSNFPQKMEIDYVRVYKMIETIKQ